MSKTSLFLTCLAATIAERHRHCKGDRMRPQMMIDPTSVVSEELKNFQDIADRIKPSPADIPSLQGVDVYGETLPLRGAGGGDHIIYVDFQKRYDLQARLERAEMQGRADIVENLKACRKMAGIVLLDVRTPPDRRHPRGDVASGVSRRITL